MRSFRYLLFFLCICVSAVADAQRRVFSPAEQQQISIPTPSLFARSNAFEIDFSSLKDRDYSFPLPVGKAVLAGSQAIEIETKEGDAVKAMFQGTVRLSRNIAGYGNVIVVRHDNGLETVYAYNAQNLVKVGDRVKAGQTIAIVGGKDGRTFCMVAILVDGRWINPSTLLSVKSHRLRPQVVVFRKQANSVDVSVKEEEDDVTSLDPEEMTDDPFENDATFQLDLSELEEDHWAYPLPESHVISPYGGSRRHSGVDIKTVPNDEILAAFDGVVTLSGPHYGYGNCIVIRHAFGFETLYSHQSKNLVKVGDKVKAGQVIGLTGRTGRATTEHLHFEVHFKGHRINPAILFDHAKKALKVSTLTLGKNGSVKSGK